MWDPVREKGNMLSHLGDFWYTVLAEQDVPLAHKLAHLPLQCRVLQQADSITNMLTDGGQFHDNFLLIKFTDKDVLWFGKKDALQKQHVIGQAGDTTGNSRLLDLSIPDHTLLQTDAKESVAIPWHAVAFAHSGENIRFSDSMYLKFGLAIDPNLRVTSIRTDRGKILYEYQDFVSEYGRLYFYRNPISLFPRMEFLAHSYDYRRRNIYCYPLGVDVYGPVDRIIYYARISQSPRSLYRAAAQAAGIPVCREDCRVVATAPLGDGLSYYTSDGRRYDADFPHTHLKRGTELKKGEVIGGKELYNLILPQDPIPGNITYITLDCALPVKGLTAPNKVITAKSGSTLRPAFEGETEALNKYYEWLVHYSGNSAYSSIPTSVNGITLVRDYLCARRVVIACVNVYQMPRDMYLRLVAFLRRELPLGSVLCTAPLYIPIDETADMEKPKTPPAPYPLVDQDIGDPRNKRNVNLYWWQWGPDLVPYGTLKRVWAMCSTTIPNGAYTGSFYLGVWQATPTRDGMHFQRIATSREAQSLSAGGTLEFTFRDTSIRGRTLRFAPVLNPKDGWWPTAAKLGMAIDDPEEKDTKAYSWEYKEELWRAIGGISIETGKLVTEATTPEEELLNWLLQFTFESEEGPIGEVDLSYLFDVEDPELREKMHGYIDWGDGSPRTEITPDMPPEAWRHEYAGEGPYNLGINGRVAAKSGASMADTGLGPYLHGVEVQEKSPIDEWEELKETPDTFHGLSFRNCPNLEGVSGDIYEQLNESEKEGVKDLEFGELFKGCESLKEVPEGLFDFPALDRLDATSMFEGCTGLSKVPKDIFPYPPSGVLITERMFAGCTGLRGKVPPFLTQETAPSELWDAEGMFEGDAGLSGVVPDFFVMPPGGETVFTDMFRGCTGLSGLEEPDYEYYSDTDRKTWVDGMFYGCSGLNSEIPDMWNHFTDPQTEHEDCFKQDWNSTNWEEVPMDWGGEEQFQFALRFYMHTDRPNQEVNIAAWFCGEEAEHQGRIKWGDHVPVVDFSHLDPEGTFRHVYATPGDYRLEVTHTVGQDYVRMNGLLTSDFTASVTSIRSFLTSVDMKETVKVKYIGDGIFDGCDKLKRVIWPKLFLPDFFWVGPEVFVNALRLRFKAEAGDEVNLLPWLKETEGRVKWGEYGEVVAFTSGEGITHRYKHENEYWIEIEPNETGVLQLDGLIDSPQAENVRSRLTGVDVKGVVKLRYIGDGVFDSCASLRYVNWSKLFRPDFADFPSEEMFPNALRLKIKTMSKEIDISAWFAGLGYGRIKWGDHSGIFEFTPETPPEAFKHTYDRDGEHFLEIAPAEGQDRLKMRGLLTSDAETSVASIRGELNGVDVIGTVNLEFLGDGIFDSCEKLEEVAWPKLFHPDFAYESDERFSTALGLKLTFLIPEASRTVDLTSWFKGEKVKVFWGEGEGGAAFGPEASDVAYRHTYKTPGEYVVTVFPSPYADPTTPITFLGEPDASIAEVLTAVDLDEGRKVKYAGDATFAGCGKLTSFAWEKLFTEVGEVDCTRMFAGCVGLTSVPDFTTGFTPTTMTEMFHGCSGLKGELPRWWEKWEALPHEDCFTGCLSAKNFPIEALKGWAALEGPSLKLLLTTPSAAYALDLNERVAAYTGETHTPALAWGDGEVIELSKEAELSHTYAEAGEKEVLIAGEVELKGITAEEKDGLCSTLTGVEVPTGESGIAQAGAKLFYLCEGMTAVPDTLFNGLKEVADLSYGFSGSGVKEVPPALLSTIPPEAGPLVLDYLFANCLGLTSVPAGLLPIKTEIGSMVGLFSGCEKVTKAVPEWWKNEELQALPHEKFFSGCKAAENWVDIPEDWGGEEVFAKAALFTITTTEENQELNLAAWYKGEEEECRGRIKWGNRTPMTVFDSTSPEETFKHTYATPGEYVVEVACAKEQDYARMNGLTRSAFPESATSIRTFLTTVDMREVTPIKYVGDGVFEGCTLLHSVAWDKLFTSDFSWDGEEVFQHALRLKLSVTEGGYDLSAWLKGGSGKVKWEDRSITTFSTDSGDEVFRHTPVEPGEYWVEVAPEGDDAVTLHGLVENAQEASTTFLRGQLLSVDTKGGVKLKYNGTGTFDGCTALSSVAWDKLFSSDFYWEGEEIFKDALRIRIFGREINPTSWFKKLGEVQRLLPAKDFLQSMLLEMDKIGGAEVKWSGGGIYLKPLFAE